QPALVIVLKILMMTAPQLSLAVGSSKVHACPIGTVLLCEQAITGGSVSRTVIVNVHVVLLPLASVAVFVTVVVPIGNVLPLAGMLTMPVTEQLSVAVTRNVTLLLLQLPASALTTMLPGQLITGFCVSFTVTVK